MFGFKNKLCKNCKHFKKHDEVYGIAIGFCQTVAGTSEPYKGDFVFTQGQATNPQPLKVAGNFGCIRFKK